MRDRLWILLLQAKIFLIIGLCIGFFMEGGEYAAVWLATAVAAARILLPLWKTSRREALSYAFDLTSILGGFVLGFWAGRSVRYSRNEFGDMHAVVEQALWTWPILLVAGTASAFWLNRYITAKRIYGPYCRKCGYHLVGVTEKRCPECGRPFTLEELRVTEDELKAS